MALNLRIGRAGEYLVASHLIRSLDELFEAPSSSRYDYLVHNKENVYKVQVKTTASKFEHHSSDWVRWDLTKRVRKIKKGYTKEEVDLFAFVYLPLDIVEFIPNYKLGKTYQKKVEYLKEVDTYKSLRRALTIVDELK